MLGLNVVWSCLLLGVPLLPFFLMSISCLGKTFSFAAGMHASFFCILGRSLGHVRANVYFTLYLIVLSLSSLALARICFFSAIVGSCTLRSLILLADGLPSLVTETMFSKEVVYSLYIVLFSATFWKVMQYYVKFS